MKSVQEIIKLKEYQRHVFTGALTRFANDYDAGPSLYFDSFRDKPIIYHLRESSSLMVQKDEVVLSELKSFIQSLVNIQEDIIETLESIFNYYNQIATNYEYDDSTKSDEILQAYEIKTYGEMWENKEFEKQYKEDVAIAMEQLRPLQNLVKSL